jgi:hypothetical protein
MNTIATVKTLTAEVRVLMVGNRQVTLSVYRQLDEVDDTELEPFGRVNDSKDRCIWVVGRSRTTGELVRAKAVPSYGRNMFWGFEMPVGALEIGAQAIWSKLRTDPETTADRVGAVTVDDRGVKYFVHKDYPTHEDATRLSITAGWWPEVERLAREVIDARAKVDAAYKHLRDLPLIVLAGLR